MPHYRCWNIFTYRPVSTSLQYSLKPEMLKRSLTNLPLIFISNWEFECRLGDMLTSRIQGFRFRSSIISNPKSSYTLELIKLTIIMLCLYICCMVNTSTLDTNLLSLKKILLWFWRTYIPVPHISFDVRRYKMLWAK